MPAIPFTSAQLSSWIYVLFKYFLMVWSWLELRAGTQPRSARLLTGKEPPESPGLHPNICFIGKLSPETSSGEKDMEVSTSRPNDVLKILETAFDTKGKIPLELGQKKKATFEKCPAFSYTQK